MSNQNSTAGRRMASWPNEQIDRSRTISFSFAGKQYSAHPGDTIASALTAHGVKVLSRSFKYHRPRGLMGYGHSPASMVQIGNEPSVNAWTRLVEDGMEAIPVNAWPSLDNDLMSINQLGSRFLKVGFYYKTFIHPQNMWPQYEKVLRNAAGLGKIDINAPLAQGYDKQYVHGDVVIVGGGPAGMQAALSAAEQGARVLLFDENPALGGHLLMSSQGQDKLAELRSAVEASDKIDVATDTIVMGWFEDNWLYGVSGQRMYKIRGKSTLFATGAYDQPLIFDNNDLPGVMLGSAARRLLHMYGTSVGSRVVIVTANDDGWQLAQEFQNAGVEVVAIADHRTDAQTPNLPQDCPVYMGQTIVKAEGKKEVKGAILAPVYSGPGTDSGAHHTVECDAIIMSTSWAPANSLLYQSGAKISYDEKRNEFLPETLSKGIFVAGRLAGTHNLETQLAEGALAGRAAVAYARGEAGPAESEYADIAARKADEPVRTSAHYKMVGDKKKGKRFVDHDEDVTDKDVHDAIAEGYNSVELLKRYTTISMGPSQGRWSSINTIHLTSQQNDQTVAETGTTTARPPAQPIELGALAGQMMEPVRYTPIHQWSLNHGAKMMVSGVWMRPEHYGDPHAEVRAVREGAGIIDVTTLGKIKLVGPGVPELLNKLYINKWLKLGVGRVRYGIMCTTEGVVMDDGVTARVGENEWYMSTTSSGAGAVYEWIQWWLQSGWGEGIYAASLSEAYSAFNLAGPKSREILAKITDGDLSNDAFPYMHIRELNVAGAPCRVMRIGFTGELSYEVHCPSSMALHVWEAIMEAGAAFGIKPFGMEAQRILRLEKAHIIVGQDTDATSDPVSANQGWALKMDKDDFLGQRGLTKVSKDGPTDMLVGFKMIDPITPEEGLQIVRDVPISEARPLGMEIIGWVTSSRFSPTTNENIGLCWLPVDIAQQPGAEFTIRRNGERIRAAVHHGAFVDPDGGRLKS